MAIHHTNTFTIMGSISHQQSLFSNPLFSSIVTLYILILLYFPQILLKIIFSPLLISTLTLLLFLLRLGASQQLKQQPPPSPTSNLNSREGATAPPRNLIRNTHNPIKKQLPNEHGLEPEPKPKPDGLLEPEPEPNMADLVLTQKEPQCDNRAEAQLKLEPGPMLEPETCEQSQSIEQYLGKPEFNSKILLEWDVGAPLEVIYEAYEGEEEGEALQNDAFWRNTSCNKAGKTEKYPSLSRYYPETDSDSDSDSDSGLYSEDEEKEGLIEIALDYGFGDKRIINLMMKKAEEKEEFHFDDEDNLIEIDISTNNMYDFAW